MGDGVVQRPEFSAFEERVGDEFTCDAGEVTLHLELESASSTYKDDDGVVKAFTLLFHLKEDVPFQQNTLTLKHPSMGEQLMFLVNVGPHNRGSGFLLEAVFN